jgi:hypothetical protein
MRSKAEAPSPDRSGSIFSPGPKALSHSRRSLSPAEFGKCRIDEFFSRGWDVELPHRWWLGRACRSSSAGRRAALKYSGCSSLHPIPAPLTAVAGPHLPILPAYKHRRPKSHQNHDVAVAARDMPIGNVAKQYPYAKGARAHGSRSLSHFETGHQLLRSGRHGCVRKLWNESRTNRGRIADSARVRVRSRRHVAAFYQCNTRSGSRMNRPFARRWKNARSRASRPKLLRADTVR